MFIDSLFLSVKMFVKRENHCSEMYFTLNVEFQMTIKRDWVAEYIKSVNLIQTKKNTQFIWHIRELCLKEDLNLNSLQNLLTGDLLWLTFNPPGLIFDYLFKNFIDLF